MHIRRCEERDRELYLRLAREFYHSPAVMHPVPDSYFERTFDEMMRSDVYADGFLLEDEDGTCMGYALTAKSFSQECGGQCVWVEELYVLPAYQGKGMGSRVFELLNAYYPDCCRFRLEVEPENEGAARLYRRLGYEALGYDQYVLERQELAENRHLPEFS